MTHIGRCSGDLGGHLPQSPETPTAGSTRSVTPTCFRSQLAISRKELGTLILPGQRGLHMKGERDPRRREIADTIVRMGDMLGIQAVIYDAGRAGTEKQHRAPCLEALVEDAAKHDQAKIVFDLDDSLRSWDRQQMIELTRAAGVMDRIAYEHRTRYSEGPPFVDVVGPWGGVAVLVPPAGFLAGGEQGEWSRRVVVMQRAPVRAARWCRPEPVRAGLSDWRGRGAGRRGTGSRDPRPSRRAVRRVRRRPGG